ncbi:MAG: Fibronectin type III domain protein [Spirochaetes bacterium ADurb.Bin133]|jgi:hypothetical protein|nr:MAG: Fibronectin type III domain protein [Spirochaetes bacterium ADurb.Bin133]
MKKTNKMIYLIIIVSTFLGLNCLQNIIPQVGNSDGSKNTSEKYGSLNINITKNSRTIAPDFLSIDHYDLTGDGPDGNTINVANILGTTKKIENLLVGSWSLTVLGKDSNNNTIAKGSASASIIENATTDLNIALHYQQIGYGSVDLTIDWDPIVSVDSVILQINNDPTIDIFTGGSSVNYANGSVSSGFYKYIFKLMKNGKMLSSVIESVHIYDYHSTTKTITLTTNDFDKAPNAPSGLTAAEGYNKIVLDWTDNSKVETGFVVERSESSGSGYSALGGTDATPLSANTTTFDDTTAVIGTTYYYRVKAVNSFGSSAYSNEASAKCDPPSITFGRNGNVAPQKEQTTDVTVTDQSGMAEGYPKYQWTQSATFPAEGTWTQFTSGDTLCRSTGDGDYYLHIYAIDGKGNESKATSNKFVLETTPPVIGGAIWFSNTTTSGFTVNWGEATDDNGPLQYKLYYSTTDNLWDVTGCETNGIVAMEWSSNTSYNMTGLSEKKSYYFNAIVKDAAGNTACYDMKQGDTDPTVVNIGKDGIGTDGNINCMVQKDGILYIGGSFSRVGRFTQGALLDMSSDYEDANFPAVNGSIRRVISDGGGGWIIGGGFTQVGAYTRNRIAWINSDGSVRDWNPNVNGEVYTLAVSGNNVYVGGYFTSIGGKARNRIAAIDITTGLATDWNPNADRAVRALAVSGSNVYVGGYFTSIGGKARNRIAAIDITTGLATDWNPNASYYVYTLAASGSNVYVGGDFTTIGGKSRNYIAAIDITTGLATDWNPDASGDYYAHVYTLAVSGSNVYVGGNFDSIGGKSRRNIAAIDITTGLATDWDPNASGDHAYVNTLAVSGSNVYVGGSFITIGGQSRSNIAAIDITTGLATDWDPNASSDDYASVSTLAVSGSNVYVGGHFTAIGGKSRSNIAAIDISTGLATDWNPNASGDNHDTSVNTLAVSGSNVYVGGDFTAIGGKSRNYIAAIDITTGLATDWNPNAIYTINTLAVSGSNVYVGGWFPAIGGQSRNYIAAIDITTGLATDWNPSANGEVITLAVSGSNVYVGGDFTTIGSKSRSNIAAIDISTGLATDWNPNADGTVSTLAASGSNVYVGGWFTTIGGQTRSRIAAIDITTGLATDWNPNASGVVYTLAVSGSNVYVGGYFTTIGGKIRGRIAAIDISTGEVK